MQTSKENGSTGMNIEFKNGQWTASSGGITGQGSTALEALENMNLKVPRLLRYRKNRLEQIAAQADRVKRVTETF